MELQEYGKLKMLHKHALIKLNMKHFKITFSLFCIAWASITISSQQKATNLLDKLGSTGFVSIARGLPETATTNKAQSTAAAQPTTAATAAFAFKTDKTPLPKPKQTPTKNFITATQQPDIDRKDEKEDSEKLRDKNSASQTTRNLMHTSTTAFQPRRRSKSTEPFKDVAKRKNALIEQLLSEITKILRTIETNPKILNIYAQLIELASDEDLEHLNKTGLVPLTDLSS